MASIVITPPDLIDNPNAYLIVNANIDDVEMVMRWLRIRNIDYTINLYHDSMNDPKWLESAAQNSKNILVDQNNTTPASLTPLYKSISKVTWIGDGHTYSTAIDYFTKNG